MKTTDLFSTSSKKLNESLSKTFGKKLNLETFALEQLHDARNKLRTQVSQIRGQSGFNENLENDAFYQAQWMLDAINAEIAERDEHIIEADVEEGKMKDLHQDVEEYLTYMSDVLTDQERYDLSHEFHELAYKLDDIGIGGVMKEINRRANETGSKWWKGVAKEFSKKFGKFAEGFDSELEEGEHEVDYKLHQLALYGDEDDLIDALGGDQGTHVAEALKDMMEELKDELASKGMNDVMSDDDKMIEMLADKLFDEYGEDGEEYGPMDSRYERNDGSADADALKSAGFGSDEDYESVQFEDRIDEKAVSKAQQRAAGIALAAKRKGKTPPGKGAAAEMAKMSIKELEKYAGTKHKNLPAKKDESVDQVDEMTRVTEGSAHGYNVVKWYNKNNDQPKLTKWLRTHAGLPKDAPLYFDDADLVYGEETIVPDALVDTKLKFNDLLDAVIDASGSTVTKESVNTGEDMTTLREGEVQQASAIVTAKTMVDRVGRWIEELSGMENETLLQLGDSIRDEMGQEQAKAFIESVAPAIQSALETLKSTRETLSTGVRSLASGEQPADMLGAEPSVDGEEMPAAEPDAMNTEMPAEEPVGDEFAAAEPATGGAEATGREQRESIDRQNRLLSILAG